MKQINIITLSRREGLAKLANQVIEAEKDDKNYRSIAYFIDGSRNEILNELKETDHNVTSIRSILQVDDWYHYIYKLQNGELHTFYYDEKWAPDSYLSSNKNLTVIQNILNSIYTYALDDKYTIIVMLDKEE